MNALGAKIVKAEMLGNTEKAKKLKEKLDNARKAMAEMKAQGGSVENATQEETVILTRTDSKGMTRPVETDVVREQAAGGRRKKGKVQTHAEGERVRYFADDDRYDLKAMFQREKLSTAEDQNSMMSRLAGKAIERTDDDYDIDDVFTSRAAKKTSEEQDLVRDRDRAVREHQRLARTLEECRFCFGGPAFQKHLMVAIGKTCYLALPQHTSLTEDHCYIVPMSHVKSVTMADEDVFAELLAFRKALTRMYEADDDRDCVFFETAMGFRHNPHMVVECVPLPRENGDTAPMFFQKAIQECETEWSNNKKLITLSKEKDVRRSVPKGLPYFHVDFGMQNGFAHVIEDEELFPRNFAAGNKTSQGAVSQVFSLCLLFQKLLAVCLTWSRGSGDIRNGRVLRRRKRRSCPSEPSGSSSTSPRSRPPSQNGIGSLQAQVRVVTKINVMSFVRLYFVIFPE